MTTYAVTGTSGHLGRLVVESLLAKGVAPADVVAVARTTEKVADLTGRGVQVREGDYDRPETLDTALAGVDRLLLVSGSAVGRRVAQHTAVVEAARAAGVGRIAYTSVLRADDSTLVLAPEHKATEEIIIASGLPHTFLRNGWYTENFTGQVDTYLAAGAIAHAAGEGRIAAVTRDDLAEAAAVALLEDRGEEVVHELAGPSFTYDGLATAITDVTGTPVAAQQLPEAELTALLSGAGLDEGTVGFLVVVDGNIRDGELDGDVADLERLLGRPATRLDEALRSARAVPQAV